MLVDCFLHHCPCSIRSCTPLSIVLGNNWKPLNKDSETNKKTPPPLAQHQVIAIVSIYHHMNYIWYRINCNYIIYVIYLSDEALPQLFRPVRAFPKRSTPSGSRFANQRSSWILSTSNKPTETASCWSSLSLSFGFCLLHMALSDILYWH